MTKDEIQKRVAKFSKQTLVEVSAVLIEAASDDHEELLQALQRKDDHNRRARLYKQAKKAGMVK